jgi:hypothetical protein
MLKIKKKTSSRLSCFLVILSLVCQIKKLNKKKMKVWAEGEKKLFEKKIEGKIPQKPLIPRKLVFPQIQFKSIYLDRIKECLI